MKNLDQFVQVGTSIFIVYKNKNWFMAVVLERDIDLLYCGFANQDDSWKTMISVEDFINLSKKDDDDIEHIAMNFSSKHK